MKIVYYCRPATYGILYYIIIYSVPTAGYYIILIIVPMWCCGACSMSVQFKSQSSKSIMLEYDLSWKSWTTRDKKHESPEDSKTILMSNAVETLFGNWSDGPT